MDFKIKFSIKSESNLAEGCTSQPSPRIALYVGYALGGSARNSSGGDIIFITTLADCVLPEARVAERL